MKEGTTIRRKDRGSPMVSILWSLLNRLLGIHVLAGGEPASLLSTQGVRFNLHSAYASPLQPRLVRPKVIHMEIITHIPPPFRYSLQWHAKISPNFHAAYVTWA